jgi:Replication protein
MDCLTGTYESQNGSSGLFLSHVHIKQTSSDAVCTEPAYTIDGERMCAREVFEFERQWGRLQPATADETDFRHSGWASTRDRVREAMRVSGAPASRLERFDACGSDCWFEHNSETGEIRTVANYCGDRFCVPCSNARAWRIRRRLAELWGAGKHSMVTLTLLGAGETLEQLVERLNKSFAKLRGRKYWASRVTGGCSLLEIKRTSEGSRWHVHLHVLCACRFLEWDVMRAEWHACTGDSHVVNIRAAPDGHAAIHYATKYVTKGFDRTVVDDPACLKEAITALRGKRLMLTFGDWHGSSEKRAESAIGTWKRFASLGHVLHASSQGELWAIGLLRGGRSVAPQTRRNPAEVDLGP